MGYGFFFDFVGASCTLPETNIFPPENGWLEDDPFFLGLLEPIFRGVNAVSFRGVNGVINFPSPKNAVLPCSTQLKLRMEGPSGQVVVSYADVLVELMEAKWGISGGETTPGCSETTPGCGFLIVIYPFSNKSWFFQWKMGASPICFFPFI